MRKKIISLIACVVLSMTLIAGCGKSGVNDKKDSNSGNSQDKLPELKIAWGNELHTGVLNILGPKSEEFKKQGVYFNPLSDDKFELIQDGKKLAIMNFIPTKGGSETANMLSQNNLDYGLCFSMALMSVVDNGAAVKIISPFQSNGIALVFPKNSNLKSWEAVKKHIEGSNTPVKIGYHSPVSAPRIVMESVLKKEGLKVTEDPSDSKAQVLLVDLKGSNNLLPSLGSKQVDAWVGPSHHPEAAEDKGVGEIAITLKNFPEVGAWDDFPCCSLGARDEVVKKYPEATKALIKLLGNLGHYANENKDDVAKILSQKIGVSESAIKKCEITYFTKPSEKWYNGIKVYADALNSMGKFSGELKGKSFEDVKTKSLDFRFLDQK